MEENTNIISLTDEEGVERDFEVITVLKVEDTEYAVLYQVDAEDEEAVVFKIVADEEGNEMLEIIEDDAEFDKVAEVYTEWLDSEECEDEHCGGGCGSCGCGCEE